jgi:hypothetical protein
MMDDRETITLTLRPLPSNIPVLVRVRAALKRLLRSYRLRCVRIGGATDQSDSDETHEFTEHQPSRHNSVL